METASNISETPVPDSGQFVTTHWSVVLSAREQGSPACDLALEKLCRTYWYPLYAHVRRLGHNPPDAEDLTQEFFARLLQKNYLRDADRAKGRFRTFLLVALEHFLANDWDRQRAQKRGGGRVMVPLDTALAEHLYAAEAGEDSSPMRAYERRWALTLVEQALKRLRVEYAQGGKIAEFERFKPFLTAERASIPYGAVAAELGISEGALRVSVHRLRHRFREIFREEIAHTLADPGDVAEEMRYLVEILAK